MPMARLPGLRQLPQALGPIREDTVLFDSWRGQYSDSPRAISDELHGRALGLRHVWVLDPELAGEVPEWVEPVAPGSREHLAALGRARYLVTNSTAPGYHRKRRGTTFLQTWHGTPLKKIAFHISWDDSKRSQQALETLKRNIPNWDLLLSPNSFSTPIFRDAFGYSGEIAETGYPRNDVLSAPEAPELRAAARARLAVAEGQRVVLYAPTFRDGQRFAHEADMERLATELSNSHVVLMRTHKLDAGQLSLGERATFKDVSAYPDNRELYLAADVLVTDYSSLMFDFAVTRKPILFFTPDLERYRDELRGFYFDFEAEAPGPLLSSVEELATAVEEIERVAARHGDAYLRFVERFCHLDDGHASARAVDALLASPEP